MASLRRRAIWIGASAFVGTLVFAWWLAQTDWARQAVLERLRRELRAQNIQLEAGRIEYDFRGLSATLYNVTVRKPNTLPPLATIDRLRVALNWQALSSDIEAAMIDGARLEIVIDKDGNSNIPQPPASADSSPSWVIRKLAMPHASLRLEDRRNDSSLTFQDVDLHVQGNPLTRRHDLQVVAAQRGELRYQGHAMPLQVLALSGSLENKTFTIGQANFASGPSRLSFGGNVAYSGELNLRTDATLHLGTVKQFLGRPEAVDGVVRLAGTATGDLAQLQVKGTLTGRALAYEDFAQVNLSVAAEYSAAAMRLRVTESTIESPYAVAQATAEVTGKSGGQSRLTAQVTRLDVERLARAAKVPFQLASAASMTVNASWPALEFDKSALNGRLRLLPTQVNAEHNRLPVAADIGFSGSLDQLKVDVYSLAAASVDGSGRFTITGRRNLSGSFSAGADSLAQAVRQSNLLFAKNVSRPDFDGRVAVTGNLAGTLGSPTVNAKLAIENLKAGQLAGAKLNTGVSYQNHIVTFDGLVARWKEQSILADGAVDLRENLLSGKARTENVRVEKLVTGPFSGNLQAEAGFGGTLQNPTAVINLTGNEIRAYSESLGDLEVNATLEGVLLRIEQLRLPKQGLLATGTYQLDSSAYIAEAKAPAMPLSYGTIALDAKGAGTVDNPQFIVNLSSPSMTVDGRNHGPVTLTASVKDHFAEIKAAATKYDAAATGKIGIAAPYPTIFNLQANAVPLNFDDRVTGSLRTSVKGEGTLDHWQEGTASLFAEPLDVKWNGEPVTFDGPIRVDLAKGTLDVKPVQLVTAGSKVLLEGSLPIDRNSTQGSMRIQGQIDLASLSKLVPDWDQSLLVSGVANLQGELKGNLERVDPTATLSLRDGAVIAAGTNPVSDLQIAAQLRDGLVTVEKLTGTWAKAKVTARGEFPLGLLPANLPIEFPRKSGLAKLTLDASGLDISSIEGVPANTSGTAAIHVEAESAKAEIASIRGRLTVEALRLRLDDVALEQTGKSSATLADGMARIENFELVGPGTNLALRGRASLLGDYPIALRLAGTIETGVLSTLIAPAKMRGAANVQLSVYGPARALKAAGFLELNDGQLLVPAPRLAADNVQARINLTGEQLSIVRFDGLLNGGTFQAKGSLRYSGGEARDIDLGLDAKNVYLDYPSGLRTLSDATLTLKQRGTQISLGGAVDIQEGSFRELVTIEGNLLARLNAAPGDDLFLEERNRYLDRTLFDVKIRTQSPLLVKNNLAKAGINVDLSLAGNYYRPALLGRITLEEGGELYFSERSYAVERGVVTFSNEQRIEPTLDILARTRAANHDISLLIAGGGAEKVTTTLSSDPAVPEQEILAMLITGKSPEEYKNADTAALASRQALSYFAGSFGSRFTRQIEKATGLSTVRVEPDLIANESNPTARLTIGQDLSKAARLVYSMNLANGGDQIYVAEYDITKRFTTRGVKQIDNTYRFEFRHDLRFGGEKPAALRKILDPRIIGKLEVPGDAGMAEKTLRDKFKNQAGRRYDFFEIRKGLDRLDKLYRDENLLEARVRVSRTIADRTVNLALDIQPGPKLTFAYEGWDPGRKLRGRVRQIWSEGVFDAQRMDDAVRALRTALVESGYLEAKIDPKLTLTQRKLITFDIQTGAKYRGATLEFPGASAISPNELRGFLKRRDLRSALYLEPGKVRDRLRNYYIERGYLDAAVKLPVPEFAGGRATVRVSLMEGPRYQVASVKFVGNTAMTQAVLKEKSQLKEDQPYQLPLRQVSIDQIREFYLDAGYHEAQVDTTIERSPGKVAVTYRIAEGPKDVVQSIEVVGNNATSVGLVKSQLTLKEGDAVEPEKLSASRRNLYSTGAYALVDLEKIPAGDVSAGGLRPVLLRAKVREVQPFVLRYGGYFDTDRGPGAVVDFTNRNSLGSARAIGGRLRYDGNFREGRVFFSQPLLRRFPLQSIFSGFVNRSLLPTFITERAGVSVQQETRFRKRYLVNYGYRLERVHTYEKVPDEFLPFDVTLRVAPLTFTMNRESRDDILDATKGAFLSQAFEWAPKLLGSDVRFIRYYAQYFKYVALGKPVEIPLSGGIKKPRLVYAGGARLGLARGLGGQELVPSERFFAGGGTTLRGFAQNTLGPKDFLNEATGGSAVVLLNNEIRFPMASIFDGVGFVDIGNTYRHVSDFSFGDLRKAAGLGLRVRTPYFLIRLDYGFKLDRRPGESRGGFFFSIGQAF